MEALHNSQRYTPLSCIRTIENMFEAHSSSTVVAPANRCRGRQPTLPSPSGWRGDSTLVQLQYTAIPTSLLSTIRSFKNAIFPSVVGFPVVLRSHGLEGVCVAYVRHAVHKLRRRGGLVPDPAWTERTCV